MHPWELLLIKWLSRRYVKKEITYLKWVYLRSFNEKIATKRKTVASENIVSESCRAFYEGFTNVNLTRIVRRKKKVNSGNLIYFFKNNRLREKDWKDYLNFEKFCQKLITLARQRNRKQFLNLETTDPSFHWVLHARRKHCVFLLTVRLLTTLENQSTTFNGFSQFAMLGKTIRLLYYSILFRVQCNLNKEKNMKLRWITSSLHSTVGLKGNACMPPADY